MLLDQLKFVLENIEDRIISLVGVLEYDINIHCLTLLLIRTVERYVKLVGLTWLDDNTLRPFDCSTVTRTDNVNLHIGCTCILEVVGMLPFFASRHLSEVNQHLFECQFGLRFAIGSKSCSGYY